MFAEVAPGVVVPLLMATPAMVLGGFYKPLQGVRMSMPRWPFCGSIVGFVVPSTILLAFPPNTDAALNATSSLLLWPIHFMLMAADPYTRKSGVAFVVGISVVADVLAYLIIGLVVWSVAACKRRTRVRAESTASSALNVEKLLLHFSK